MFRRAFLVASIAILGITSPASAAEPGPVNDYSAVSDRRIAYTSFSRYSVAVSHAKDTWNALNVDSNVTIAPRSNGEEVDLHFQDQYLPGEEWYGLYQHYSEGTDIITFNTYHLGPANSSPGLGLHTEKAIAAHEMGHALGLDHNLDTDQLMHECPGCQNDIGYSHDMISTPQDEDIAAYYYLWP